MAGSRFKWPIVAIIVALTGGYYAFFVRDEFPPPSPPSAARSEPPRIEPVTRPASRPREQPVVIPDIAETIAPPPKAAAEAKIAITSPDDGAIVQTPVIVTFAVAGIRLAPAGTDEAGTGHIHLLVDTPIDTLSGPFRRDALHHDLGGGENTAEIDLSPGAHTLQAVLGDGNHITHDPPIASDVVRITAVQ